MPTLHLLRHAKSSWDDLRMRDHDRPLTGRGERAASAMAAWLRQNKVMPDLVLCSSARRTVDTLAAIRSGLPDPLEVLTSRELYEVGAASLLGRLHRVPDDVGVLLLIGHNPGLEDLATALAGPGSAPPACKALGRKFSTGALATLEFDGSWSGLGAGTARLTRFITPKDLV
ncbi:MAG: histidine phosphatase family protein [Thalassobaculum sp.]|uniref:SixA phosphatase family protein n=1 Tax=Thalassobaculum sp. TaxID=2022740 RepID=UPI0032EAAF9D